MTDVITATVIEAEEVVSAIVTEGDSVTVTDNGVEHEIPAGGSYNCEYGPGTPATVVDNGVEHDVMPGEEYTCQYGPAADGECHNTDESISVTVPSGGTAEFPDGELTEFDNSKTPLIAGKNVTAKVPANSKVFAEDDSELYDLPLGENAKITNSHIYDSAGNLLHSVKAQDDQTIADSIGTNPDGSTFNVRAEQAFDVPVFKKYLFAFQIDSELTVTTPALDIDFAATWNSNDLENIATIQWKVNGANVSLPFATVVGDTITAEITKTNAALAASATLKTASNG